jgi:hypothetical protein
MSALGKASNLYVRSSGRLLWDRIMDALAADPDAPVQMIDTSVVRVRLDALATEVARGKRKRRPQK